MSELTKLTIAGALAKLKSKEITASELVNSHVEQAMKHKRLNFAITETFESALAGAKEADKKYQDGTNRPLEGVPVAVKDLFCTKGVRTSTASKMLSEFVPQYDSTVSAKLASSGALSIAKTNMDEFAMGSSTTTSYFGNCYNPWREKGSDEYTLTPGGSSGGSASIVAARAAMASLGSDTGGSIRQPAAFCGLVGVKPTYGACSRYGMIAFASSLDQAGVFTRTCEDAALVLQQIMGHDPKDSTSTNVPLKSLTSKLNDGIKGMRIGLPRDIYELSSSNAELIKMWDSAIEMVQKQGAEIVDITLPNSKYGLDIYYIIASAEASSNLARYDGVKYGYRTSQQGLDLEQMYRATRTEGFGEEVKRRIMLGTYVLSSEHIEAYYIKAQRLRRMVVNDYKAAFDKCSSILLPVTPSAAFRNDISQDDPVQMYLNDLYSIPASLAGLPCMSLPTGFDKTNLPIGMQLVTPQHCEDDLLRVGRALEEACSDKDFTPRGF